MHRIFSHWPARAGTALAAAALAACGGTSSNEPSQVVARVNESEITASQLRTALAAKGEGAATTEAVRQALEGLVNEQLLVDAALRLELDRDPVVVQALESARRQLLARAYLERNVFPKDEISAADQNSYYKSHPALFGQREVYQLTAFTFPSVALTGAVMTELDAANSAEAVAAVLAAHRIDAESQTLTRAAEQLPLEQLPAFAAAEVGDVIVQAAQDGRSTVTVISGVHASPIGFESAQPIIQQYLVNMRNAEALDAHLKQARAVGSITHFDASLAALTGTPAAAAPGAPPTAADPREASVDRGAAVLN